MTRAEAVYVETLNLLGSDVRRDEYLQAVINAEHAAADPDFAEKLKRRIPAPRGPMD